jgi:hypothetical protein
VRRIAFLSAVLASFAVAGQAHAATFTVTTPNDVAGTGSCATGGSCSLRQAISTANATTAADTVVVPAGTYHLTIPNVSGDEDVNASGDLDITQPVTIQGAGAGATVIDASTIPSGGDRVVQITDPPPSGPPFSAGTVALSGLTITGGHGAAGGGGIYENTVVPTLQITNSVISGNTGVNGYGGGINSTSAMPVQITNSTISGNVGTSFGGGMMMDGSGHLTITGSTISGNNGGDGGGVWTAADATITNSTISGNTTNSIGGGFDDSSGTTSFTNTTIAFNKLATGATSGGIENFGNTINFKNTIVANNDGMQCDSGTFGYTSQGNNIDGSTTCSFTQQSDRSNTNPQLGPLQNNGGPTQTHALPKGSPAVDAGDNAACPPTDQRGQARPFDGNDDGVATCDIGAFELRGPPPTATTGMAAVTSNGALVGGVVNPNGFVASYHFDYGTTSAYGSSTTSASAGAGTTDVPVAAAIGGLAPSTVYHYRLVASGAGGTVTGADAMFTTSAPPGPGPPVEGVSANVEPVKGDVFVRLPIPPSVARRSASGAAAAKPPRFGPQVKLTSLAQIPMGSLLNTKSGTVRMFTASNKIGGTQSGDFSQGTFIVNQLRSNALTTATMTGGNFNSCSKLPTGGAAKAVFAARSRSRRLLANVHGRYRTRGRNSAATVRGTEFLMKDTCTGTLTSVLKGSVTVRDFSLRKNITVRAHHKYLARAPKRLH